VKGKNHGHQPATISLSQEFWVTRLWRLTRESSLHETLARAAQASGDGPPLRSVRSLAYILKWIWNNSNRGAIYLWLLQNSSGSSGEAPREEPCQLPSKFRRSSWKEYTQWQCIDACPQSTTCYHSYSIRIVHWIFPLERYHCGSTHPEKLSLEGPQSKGEEVSWRCLMGGEWSPLSVLDDIGCWAMRPRCRVSRHVILAVTITCMLSIE